MVEVMYDLEKHIVVQDSDHSSVSSNLSLEEDTNVSLIDLSIDL